MDLVEACKAMIQENLAKLEGQNYEETAMNCDEEMLSQRQIVPPDSIPGDSDKNLNKILAQQTHLKRMIDQDNHIQLLTSSLNRVTLEIEALRKSCIKMNEDALRQRQELIQAQAKEIERYQMGQIRSISEDYTRHQEILEQRRKEIKALQKEIEREDKERDAYLLDVEKKLEKQLQDRQRALKGDGTPFGLMGSISGGNGSDHLTDELNNPDHIELTSIDEYAPYGTAPHSRMPARGGRSRGRGRGARRARRG